MTFCGSPLRRTAILRKARTASTERRVVVRARTPRTSERLQRRPWRHTGAPFPSRSTNGVPAVWPPPRRLGTVGWIGSSAACLPPT
eukprot:3887500-Alexandrium_andersonii.AAC.1